MLAEFDRLAAQSIRNRHIPVNVSVSFHKEEELESSVLFLTEFVRIDNGILETANWNVTYHFLDYGFYMINVQYLRRW